MRQRIIRELLIGSVLILTITTGFSPVPENKKTGQELFEKNCKQCHGKDGTKGMWGAKNLQTSRLPGQEILNTITKGRKRMPAWGKVLDAEQLTLVSEYVITLRK